MAIIGFVNTDLSISEDGGDLRFEIAVLQGTLRIDVPVNFATDNGTALGKSLRMQLSFLSILSTCSWTRL